MANENKSPNVPPLRFPEFSGEWKKVRFGEIGKGFDYGMNAPAKAFDGKNTYIRITDIDEESSRFIDEKRVSPDGKLEDAYRVRDNDILLARTGASTGKSYLYASTDGVLYFAGFLIRVNIPLNNAYFVFSQLHTSRYWRWVNLMSARSGQPGINSQEYSTYPLYLSTEKEANKIAKFLSLIDERIAIQSRVIEDLKKLRSSIVDRLFCNPQEEIPKTRIKGFCDKWEKVTLGDIAKRIIKTNKGVNCSTVLTIAAQYGLINQEDFFNKIVASSNLDNYYLLKKGDFAYNKSYSGEYQWGAIKRLDKYEQGVLSPLYICFEIDHSKVDSDFIVHYFETTKWHKGIADISGEGARNHGLLNISIKDFFNTLHRIPTIEEQKAISTRVNALESKIAVESQLLFGLQQQKQYLLRQMFV